MAVLHARPGGIGLIPCHGDHIDRQRQICGITSAPVAAFASAMFDHDNRS